MVLAVNGRQMWRIIVRALHYTGVHVHVCGISRWSQYAAREEVEKIIHFCHLHVLQWVEPRYTELLYNELVGIM